MSKNYDNWEKLVGAVLKREQFRQLALSHSTSCSTISDDVFSWRFDHHLVRDERKNSQTVSLIIDDAFVWERFLLPQTESRLARGKVLFIPVEAREFVILTEESTGTNLYHSPSCFGHQELDTE